MSLLKEASRILDEVLIQMGYEAHMLYEDNPDVDAEMRRMAARHTRLVKKIRNLQKRCLLEQGRSVRRSRGRIVHHS